jgi:hypothetical protein
MSSAVTSIGVYNRAQQALMTVVSKIAAAYRSGYDFEGDPDVLRPALESGFDLVKTAAMQAISQHPDYAADVQRGLARAANAHRHWNRAILLSIENGARFPESETHVRAEQEETPAERAAREETEWFWMRQAAES